MAAGAVVAWVVPVGAAGGVGGCALLTKKEVAKLLGGKVIKTKNKVRRALPRLPSLPTDEP